MNTSYSRITYIVVESRTFKIIADTLYRNVHQCTYCIYCTSITVIAFCHMANLVLTLLIEKYVLVFNHFGLGLSGAKAI